MGEERLRPQAFHPRSKQTECSISICPMEVWNDLKVRSDLMQRNICIYKVVYIRTEQQVWQKTQKSKAGSDPNARSEMKRQPILSEFHVEASSELEHENIFPITLKLLWLYTVHVQCSLRLHWFFKAVRKQIIYSMFSSQNHHLHGFCPALCSARKPPRLQRVTGPLAG